MITNERQYRITRANAEKFQKALDGFDQDARVQAGVHPRLVQAQREAMESQLKDLTAEMGAYERLKSDAPPVISISSFDDLAEGLIQARIAGGLSQKALAEKLGLKEQQIQRYEAERYASASYQRLREVADAIGVRVRNDILLPMAPGDFPGVVTKLSQVGLDRDFVISRLLPSSDAARASGETPSEDTSALAARTASILERVYGWTHENIFGAMPLSPPKFAAAEARFKMPARRVQSATGLYAAYANYLAVVVLKGSRDVPKRNLGTDPTATRREIVSRYGDLTFKSALNYSWDCGVPVLPLRDKGTFHGACWRYEGRNVVVLKQNSKHQSRWLFDLIHEWFHAAQTPEAETLEVIEADENSTERRNSEEEIAASQFAGDVTLDARAEDIAQVSVQAAAGSVERLKSVVPKVAQQEGVDVGALANYLAFRLSWQGVNWWGAAANLQSDDKDPWTVARDVFVERFPFKFESDIDRQLLDRALH